MGVEFWACMMQSNRVLGVVEVKGWLARHFIRGDGSGIAPHIMRKEHVVVMNCVALVPCRGRLSSRKHNRSVICPRGVHRRAERMGSVVVRPHDIMPIIRGDGNGIVPRIMPKLHAVSMMWQWYAGEGVAGWRVLDWGGVLSVSRAAQPASQVARATHG